MSERYTWKREKNAALFDGEDAVVFDGPNACHNVYVFVGLSDDQLNEIAKLLSRAFWAGSETAKANIRAAMAASR